MSDKVGNCNYRKEVLHGNRGVDKTLVQRHAELERQLGKIGVEIRPQYKLDPPLGKKIVRLANE